MSEEAKKSVGHTLDLTPRTVASSRSEMIQIVLPNDTNPLHALLGGRLMHWIDLAGALAGHRHARAHVVTACGSSGFFCELQGGGSGSAALAGESGF